MRLKAMQIAMTVMLLASLAFPITIELPSDTPYKNVSGNTITTEDYYAQIYKNYSLHYYVMNIPTATVNATYNKSNVLAALNISNASVYLITNMTKHAKLIANDSGNLTYKNYTTYSTGPTESSRVQTASGRWWLIEIRTEPLKSGKYNTTVGSIFLDPTISACGFLNGANTTFTLNQSVAINGSTCFTFNATNQTLDCVGLSIMGNNTLFSSGIYSTKANTTTANCIISSFSYGIYYSNSINGIITNITSTSTLGSGYGIYLTGSGNTIISNSSGTGLDGAGIQIDSSSNTRILSSNGSATGTGHGISLSSGAANCTINNSIGIIYTTIQPRGGINIATNNNIVANSKGVANTSSATGAPITVTGSNNVFVNDTPNNPSGNRGLLYVKGGNNTFYWNNFTTTTNAYINDANGTNSYNATVNGQNEGNIYANMGSGNLTGTNQSGWNANYKVATGGGSYPYNNTTSGGKFVCSFNGCGDYAPLFYSPAAAANSCGCPASPAAWTINLADRCNFTASCSNAGNTITFNGTGYASFSNLSLSPMVFTASKFILTNFVCSAAVPCFYFKSAVWFNGTMN